MQWLFVYDPTQDRGGLITGPYNPKAFVGQTAPMGTPANQLGTPAGQSGFSSSPGTFSNSPGTFGNNPTPTQSPNSQNPQ